MKPIGAFISGCAGPVLGSYELAFLEQANPWGLILFKRNVASPDQLLQLTSEFRRATGRKDAPVFVDQEGGRVQRLGPPSNFWRAYPPARNFGLAFEKDPVEAMRATRHSARLLGRDLFEVGITSSCLPVLDVPQPGSHDVIGNRAYAGNSAAVSIIARAHVAGLQAAGILPVMKHIPGHGRSMVDSHLNLPTVTASLTELEQSDFPPFAALADLPMAMTAHVIYTAIDSENTATLSKQVIRKIIRGRIGFQGLLMSDDLSMKALKGSTAEKTSSALAAGCDIVLHCNGILEEMNEVAVAAGSLRGKALQRAKSALKQRRKPLPFDVKLAESDLQMIRNLA